MVEDRPELEVALARQDPVAVAGQLARGAAQVADLHPGQVLRGEVREVLELARAGVVVEHVEADAGIAGADCAIRASAVSRLAQNGDDF